MRMISPRTDLLKIVCSIAFVSTEFSLNPIDKFDDREKLGYRLRVETCC